MGGEVDWGDSLPLLPAGILLFDSLPARAIVLSALAPAIRDGVITLVDGSRRGVLVIRGGRICEVVSIDGARCLGDAAMATIAGWDAALMSAARLTRDAMAILGPVLNGHPCHEGLHLEWTRWPELLDDLRGRGDTYVIEVRTPVGRGVTVIRAGQQVATYTDAHLSLGEPALVDALAESGAGSLRVSVASETSAGSTALFAAKTTQRAEDSAAILSATTTEPAHGVMAPHELAHGVMPPKELAGSPDMQRAGGALAMSDTRTSDDPVMVRGNTAPATHDATTSDDPIMLRADTGLAMHVPTTADDSPILARTDVFAPPANEADQYEGNATLTALFGGALGAQPFTPLVVLDRTVPPASSSVASLLPELKLLVQQRLQRSAGRVEDVIDAAADGGESVGWLADRVRVMTVRGFMTSTLEQLADDMLALTGG